MGAHRFSTSTRQAKQPLIAQLQSHLTKTEVLSLILTQLDAFGKDALRQLLIAEGALPVHTFEKRFGPVRPYRPWRQDKAQLQPWLAPISTTEQLWYLGLRIEERHHTRYLISWCHLCQQKRAFRIDRIEAIEAVVAVGYGVAGSGSLAS